MNNYSLPTKQAPVAQRTAVYLDHHATTPVDPRVAEVAIRMMVEEFGNANGVENIHGEHAASAVAEARDKVARLLRAEPDDVYFTSGSTEAIQLAISHSIATHHSPLKIAVSRVEHKAVIDTALRAERLGLAAVTWIEVDEKARLDRSGYKRVLQTGIDLVCVMAANNEVGTIYPVDEIVREAHEHGANVLIDATQAVGRMPIDLEELNAAYVVLSGHKIYSPKGIGALVSPVFERASVFGLQGAHHPTPNVSGIAALGSACELMELEGEAESRRLSQLRDLLQQRLLHLVPGLVVNGDEAARLPHNLHVSAPGALNDVVLSHLRGKVSISTGSACNTGAQEPSHVLRAMRLPHSRIDSCLRMGLGRTTTASDIELAAVQIAQAIHDVRTAFSEDIDV
ncbi:aminotransferase class V-fold PLP-dependent enzyme [Rhizobium sp. CSW-27]|uniref:cysteine desulfurase family protein n=1 Tax=Rhizobium sp. CSW-27 TaxID=2839985 RepID=UPI001C0308B4|nr:aminotransferase class V-fold PLP-dependent enzyme [Rhizobium sp. CSW-27]MBT9372612.1 aminotransferase class V-fold PLP-dependent enzyme [Rhizobium sp. CSW-27]